MALKLNWRAAGLLRHRNAALPFLIPIPVPLGNRTTCSSHSSSSSNLFVGGLSYDTNETALKDAFSQYGDVTAVKVICHPTTGKSKGFGFVNFSSQNQAAAALQMMNGQLLDGRNIRVHYANVLGTDLLPPMTRDLEILDV